MTARDISPYLGELDAPTKVIAARRVRHILDGLVKLTVERHRVGMSIRFPRPIRVCRGLHWSEGGFFARGAPELQVEDILRNLGFYASTPKERAKALMALARIEKWVADRLAGLTQHAENVRKQQGVWVAHLNSEIAMDVLESEKHRFKSDTDEVEVPF